MIAGGLAVAVAACATAAQGSGSGGARPATADRTTPSPTAQASADSGRPRYTAADVSFLSDMIPHHAQAVLMAGWAPTHNASQSVRTLSERIVVGQQDEIAFAQRWLRERGEAVPEIDPEYAHHGTLMPGMLNAEELAQLDAAKGVEFDRLFLTFMIRHHEGAIAMVEELFRAPGAAQEEEIFRFASDVNSDQLAEIDRMTQMLEQLPTGGT
ncbi:MAG: DUF305 domain-containing protein [Gemmatimonadota bacterium]